MALTKHGIVDHIQDQLGYQRSESGEIAEIPKYNLQYLRYCLGLEVNAKAHDALGDVMILEAWFKRIHDKFMANVLHNPNQEMIKIRNNPVLMPRMPFGKHKGELFSEVPADYLLLLSTTELDEDMAYTVKNYMGSCRE